MNKNRVFLISGGTGCGKTTQVPQYILEEATRTETRVKIICTQPRRVAAMSVAKRVNFERGENLPSTIGYQVRMDSCMKPSSSLIFMMSGCLLKHLGAASESNMEGCITHIILDEVHERDLNSDILLNLVKNMLAHR